MHRTSSKPGGIKVGFFGLSGLGIQGMRHHTLLGVDLVYLPLRHTATLMFKPGAWPKAGLWQHHEAVLELVMLLIPTGALLQPRGFVPEEQAAGWKTAMGSRSCQRTSTHPQRHRGLSTPGPRLSGAQSTGKGPTL